MPNYFQANLMFYGDGPGLGAYKVGHFLQHRQYANILAAQQPPVLLPDYNIQRMGPGPEAAEPRFLGTNDHEFLVWLNNPRDGALRAQANASGDNLASLNLDSPDEWDQWQEEHRRQHALFDRHFGTM